MSKFLIYIIFFLTIFLFSCSPGMYQIQSNPDKNVLLEGLTDLTLINKTDSVLVFHISDAEDLDEEVTVEVPGQSKRVINNFECGKYNIKCRRQVLYNQSVIKGHNTFTYYLKD